MEKDISRVIELHDRLKDYNFDIIDSPHGEKILFENTQTPLLYDLSVGRQQQAYIDEPFREIFREHFKADFSYKCCKDHICEEDCRTGFGIQYIISILLPTLENELNLEQGELRLPTMEEYIHCENLYPFLKDSELAEWTSTLVEKDGAKLYLLKESKLRRSQHYEDFTHRVDGMTFSDGACPRLGFRLVVDPSKKHQMKYTTGWR